MGIDLMILPTQSECDLWQDAFLAYTRLKFERDYDIFCQIIELDQGCCKPIIRPLPIPVNLRVHLFKIDGIFVRTRKDEHGKDLTYAYAGDLKKIELPKDATPHNNAIKAFIDTLPDNLPVLLWWC